MQKRMTTILTVNARLPRKKRRGRWIQPSPRRLNYLPRGLLMERSSLIRLALLPALGVAITKGCTRPGAELDLTAYDQTQDQRKIAQYYSQEAARLQQKSEEMSARTVVYERLFGPDSDWVAGTRLLAQSYEEAAKEHERIAGTHLGLVGGRRP